jgi:hypothetical protein
VWERRGEWRIMEDRRGKVRKQMDVPLHHSPSGHRECVAYPAPEGAHGMVGWLWLSECEGGGCGWFSGVREVDQGWCQSSWQTKEREWVVVVIRGEGVEVSIVIGGEGVRSGVVVVVGGGK